MGERSGVGLVECTILEVLDALGARPGRPHRLNARVLAAVEDRIGLAPGYAYEVLLDLGRPWTMPVSLISPCGNFGSRGHDPAANFRYTESGLTRAGQVVLAAERGELGPVPVGLINGSTYRSGMRPPFRPPGIIEALRQVIQRPKVTSADLTEIVGPPEFGNGCTVSGDFAALAAGRQTVLRLEARVTVADDGTIVIENFPPNANPDETAASIADRARARDWAERYPGLHRHARLPLQDLRDESSRAADTDRIVCVPEPGTSPEQLRDQLVDIYGVYTTVNVALPRSLAAMLRGWVKAYRGEDLLASLAALEEAIRRLGGNFPAACSVLGGRQEGAKEMEPDRAVADLELFLADRGEQLLRTAVLLAGSKQAGEDLLQAALERLLRRGPAIHGDPEGYLRRTLYHLAADRWRQQSAWRRQHLLLRSGLAATAADPFAQVDQRDSLVRLLRELPPRQRAVIVARYWEQLSEAESAQVLGISVGTVKSAAARGLRRLRELSGISGDPGDAAEREPTREHTT
jgi:RNA polymerase sigma-70 factor (sigma-E family)